MMKINADDLLLLLELYRAQSLSAAAKQLGVEQSTLSRKLSQLEEHLGYPLFSRHRSGLKPSRSVESMILWAEKIEVLVRGANKMNETRDEQIKAEVHVSCPSSIADRMIAPHLPQFLRQFPLIRVRLSTANEIFDLDKLECDIAIKVGKKPKGDSFSLKLIESPLKFFGTPGFVSAKGPARIEDLPLLLLNNEEVILQKISPHLQSHQIRLISNRLATNLIAAERGAGVLLLPEIFGRYLNTLEVIDVENWPSPPVTLYLASPRVVRRQPAVDVTWNWLKSLFKH